MNKTLDLDRDETLDEPPPILRTWKRVYWFVGLYLFALISGLWLITRAFAY